MDDHPDREELERRLLTLVEDVRASAAKAAQRRREATPLEARVHFEGLMPPETRPPADVAALKVMLAPGLDPRTDPTLVGMRSPAGDTWFFGGAGASVKRRRRLSVALWLCGAAALVALMLHAAWRPAANGALSQVEKGAPPPEPSPPAPSHGGAHAPALPVAERPHANASAHPTKSRASPRRPPHVPRTHARAAPPPPPRERGKQTPIGKDPEY